MTSKFVLIFFLVYNVKHVLTDTTSEINEQQANLVGGNTTPIEPLQQPSQTPANVNDTCDYFNLYKHLFEEMNSQNHPMIQAYFNKVIQKLYENIPSNILFVQLWQIYKKCDPATFVAMVRAQLSLFWLHNMNEYPDYDYVLMAANGFYKIKSNSLYPSLNGRTKMLFERALKGLPSSLHYLFGHQEFCLLNKMHSEIMYQTDSDEFVSNNDIRFGFTWHLLKKYNDDKGKIIPIFKETNYTHRDEEANTEENELESIVTPLNVALYSKHFNNFYSRWPGYDQKIGGNMTIIPQLQLENHVWTVQLVNDDHLVFQQNEYLMCATTFYDNKRRFIYGLKNKTMNDADCQWSAGKCDRR